MITVHKFPLQIADGPQVVPVPYDARVVHVGAQAGELCLWVRLDTDEPYRDRHFLVVGTGHEAPHPLLSDHVGSVQDGPFVWHVFQLKP